jgi:hypothetical protein
VRQRVVVYVERDDELLVFDHRDDPEAGSLELRAEPVYLGEHEHLDGLGRPARSSFFRVEAPAEAPGAWEHVVTVKERTPGSSSAAASTRPRPSCRCRRSTDNRDEGEALLARSAAIVAVPSRP